MRCRKCNYSLWGLKDHHCPECGEPFDVQSFWFTPGSVVFRCPYCNHAHPGRTARGLPFDGARCEGCGQLIIVEQMSVEPVKVDAYDATSDDEVRQLQRGVGSGHRKAVIAVAIVVAALIAMAGFAAMMRAW